MPDANISIYVAPGGSSVGVSAAIDKTADFGMLARAIKDEEVQALGENYSEYIVARDALIVSVNAANPICGVIAFLFLYIFIQGAHVINWDFLTKAPSGAVLGTEGGIFPAIVGSLLFTLTAVVLGGIPAIATALFMVFYCPNERIGSIMRMVVQCIAGIPSIVLGLFSYSFLVRDLNWGRCILFSGVALAIMVLPFIEVRAEKAFREMS